MEVRIRNATRVGQQLFISSTITKRTRKLIEAKAKIALEDSTPVAEGKAIMHIVEEA